MIDLMNVREALNRIRTQDDGQKQSSGKLFDGFDTIISFLIHDIFGAEILKTRKKRGWHFYNRIDGLRIDLTRLEIDKSGKADHFEDIPSSADEIHNYFAPEDYSNFFMKFVKAFEIAVGLEKNVSLH